MKNERTKEYWCRIFMGYFL